MRIRGLLFYLIICGSTMCFAQKNIPISRKLQMAELFIQKLYVDSVDEGKLVEAGIRGMLSELDPHSTYSDAAEVKLLNASMQGEFEGIGVQYQMVQDTLFVIQTVPKGPSDKAGILAGDKIIAVNDSSIAGVNASNALIMNLLRGPRKSKVKLSIKRSGVPTILNFEIERDKIPLETIDAAYLLTPSIGYIRLSQFAKKSHREFSKALNSLLKQKIESLILDLRGNSGGFLDVAIAIANDFLDAKQRIVYAKGEKVNLGSFYAKGDGAFKTGKLAILIDEFSASASEIVAGAVQDWDRGVIIGRRSFGKGLVQRPIDLFDGSMIRLTVARYYTPSGRSIQREYAKGKDEHKNYQEDFIHRIEKGELLNRDSIQLLDSLQYQTLINNRVVYGGGGIISDVFVPADTTSVAPFINNLISQGLITQVAVRYLEKQRGKLQEKYSVDEFVRDYEAPDSLIEELKKTSWVESAPADQFDSSIVFIKKHLKAAIAQDIWGKSVMLRVYNQDDPIVIKAIEVLESENYFPLLGY